MEVALKVPFIPAQYGELLDDFRREARVATRLDHANILTLHNADIIDGLLALAYPLGLHSLADRMRRRVGLQSALDWSEQLFAALEHAHARAVIHCDVKPDNLGHTRISKHGRETLAVLRRASLGHAAAFSRRRTNARGV